MAANVAVESRILPIRVVLGLGLKTRLLAVGGQQAVGIERQEVANIELLGPLEGRIEQCDILQRQGF